MDSRQYRVQSRSHRSQRVYQCLNMDEIATFVDEEIAQRLVDLTNDRMEAVESGRQSRLFEDDICYLRREQQIRRHRREAHDGYLKLLDREAMEAKAYEDSLPMADLDNSSFIINRY